MKPEDPDFWLPVPPYAAVAAETRTVSPLKPHSAPHSGMLRASTRKRQGVYHVPRVLCCRGPGIHTDRGCTPGSTRGAVSHGGSLARGQRIRHIVRALIAQPPTGRVRRMLRLGLGLIVTLVLVLATTRAAAKPIVYPPACGSSGARMTSSAEYRSIYDPTARGRQASPTYERYCKALDHARPTTTQAFLR